MDSATLRYFEALTKDRENSANVLEKPSMSGVQRTVVEKYSEQAHFVYELIQNADDAKATYARFVLQGDRLIFAHNGSRHFTVSDPATEREDQDRGRLGDVNSITAIAFSNKNEEATIGKFGVGFKAVFTYTETPHIYGPTLHFKIERFIVPKLLGQDHPNRREDETLFVFPFDKRGMPPAQAVREISERLLSLEYPVLFLNSLQRIDFVTPGHKGHYYEEEIERYRGGDVTAQLLRLDYVNAEGRGSDEMWLMSTTDSSGYKLSVGFFVDRKGKLTPREMPAFCFFPTKVSTNLNFVINAPFLLTDSREGIKYGDQHNLRMIEELGGLAATSLELLCSIGEQRGSRIVDDNMFDVVPYERLGYYGYGYGYGYGSGSNISFNPIIEALMNQVQYGHVLPGVDGYRGAKGSFVMESARISELLDERQLQELIGSASAGQVLRSLTYASMDRSLRSFLERIGVQFLTDNRFLEHITSGFIEKQNLDWLNKLHGFIVESRARTDKSRTLPVFQDSGGSACRAFDENGNEQLFLPSKDSEGYRVLSPEALELAGTKKLVDTYGLKPPSLRDKIFSRVLPQFGEGRSPRNDEAFEAIYRYYKEEGESKAFLREISGYPFLAYTSGGKAQAACAKASELYLPTDKLTGYFQPKRYTKFVDVDYYLGIVGEAEGLSDFLRGLGVLEEPRLVSRSLEYWEAHQMGVQWAYCTPNRPESWRETDLDGLSEAMEYLSKNHDWGYSVLLWNTLVEFIGTRCNYQPPTSLLTGVHEYFYYNPGQEAFDSRSSMDLRRVAWVSDTDGKPVSPNGLDKTKLSERYDTSSRGGTVLAGFLGIKEPVIEEQSEREKWADSVDDIARRAYGASLEEFLSDPRKAEAFERFLREEARRDNYVAGIASTFEMPEAFEPEPTGYDTKGSRKYHQSDSPCYAGSDGAATAPGQTHREESPSAGTGQDEEFEPESTRTHATTDEGAGHADDNTAGIGSVKVREYYRSHPGGSESGEVAEDIVRRAARKSSERRAGKRKTGKSERDASRSQEDRKQSGAAKARQKEEPAWDEPDEDDLTPSTVDYDRHTERARERCAQEIDDLEHEEYLRNSAISAETYSFKWFKALIELEAMFDRTGGRKGEFSITFASVRLEAGTTRTLVLEQPSRTIPPSVEDLSNIPLVLELADRTMRIEIEVASVRSYTLRVRLKDGAEISGIDLAKVEEARIEVRNPTFLLEELRKRFSGLNLKDDFNMRDNLPENVEFVFGPPGTGKTTYLAKNVLIPLMEGEEDVRVLVLTPTNKAADVLARKIVECAGGADRCKSWLVRFGITDDSELESSGIYRDKTFDFSSLARSVTVTTVARYPYDYFMTSGGHMPLRRMDWDYVIFDEASMISCAQITYPLYRANPRKFIVAGDPHQISPVLKVDLWESESIYTMVKLSSFERPTTVPHPYKVTLLGTQYRSVPAIGQVFSEFSYDGMLKNARNGWDANRAYLGKELGGQAISIIRFPVSPYESIYKPKQLDHKSAYQPYAAILTFELVKHLVGRLETEGTSRKTSIGIVSPYRAQADLLAGLLGQIRLPEQVTVQAGTIHGFQGDECDLMIVVLNTPPSISRKPGMFLNRRNILNVSVSRAKDSLILLVPDENTKDLDRLREVNRLRSICQRTGSVKEFSSSSIEKQLFGSETFIEGNCFSTGHQSVNVYGRPEQRYEIRSESQAVDIQVHDEPNHQGRQEEASSQAHTHSTAPATTVPSVISSSASQKQDSINNQASRTIRPSASQASTSQALQRQSTTGPSHPTKPLPWGIEELRRLKANYKLYMDVPRTLQTLFPNRTLREIDVKAVELRIVDRLPVRTGVKQQNPANTQRTTGRTVGPSAKQQPQARKSDKERERERMRKRPWDASEIAILRRNYPKYGSDMKKWDQMLQYRQKKAIEAQAHKLGLA